MLLVVSAVFGFGFGFGALIHLIALVVRVRLDGRGSCRDVLGGRRSEMFGLGELWGRLCRRRVLSLAGRRSRLLLMRWRVVDHLLCEQLRSVVDAAKVWQRDVMVVIFDGCRVVMG